MRWAVPLARSREGDVECSATMIGPQVLLTAAHCIDGPAPPALRFDGGPLSLVPFADLRHRACLHGTCDDPFPDRQRDSFKKDVATIWMDAPHESMATMDSFPQLASITGPLPGAYMLSRHHGKPRAVCRSHATDRVGKAEGSIVEGDSGSSVVALREDGTASVLGVVSHRDEAARWYFAMIPDSLPWPAGARGAPPPVHSAHDGAFSAIEDCP
jgi:hypothetical protein